MEKKDVVKVSTWSYTCKVNGRVYHSKEYGTRDELAAVVSELVLRTPLKYTTLTIIRTDAWR